MPVSMPTTSGPSPPSKICTSPGVTSRARSRPAIGGSASIRSRACASGSSASKTPPRIAPCERMWRTSARVSTPVSAGTPQSDSQVSQPPSACAESSRSMPSRMITARAWMRSDSMFACETP